MTLAIGFHALYRLEAFLQVPGGWGAGIGNWRGAWMAWMAWMMDDGLDGIGAQRNTAFQ
jgi:hypothetical protein